MSLLVRQISPSSARDLRVLGCGGSGAPAYSLPLVSLMSQQGHLIENGSAEKSRTTVSGESYSLLLKKEIHDFVTMACKNSTLTMSDLFIWFYIVSQTDHRSGRYAGTIKELAQDLSKDYDRTRRAVNRLCKASVLMRVELRNGGVEYVPDPFMAWSGSRSIRGYWKKVYLEMFSIYRRDAQKKEDE